MLTRYWAGGFSNKNHSQSANKKKLKEFIDHEYWQALYYKNDDKSPAATNARNLFSEISIGDKFLIKGYGGTHDLVVRFVGEVIAKNEEIYRLDLRRENIDLYHDKAPSGQGAGNWFNTLLEIRRPEDIKILFRNK